MQLEEIITRLSAIKIQILGWPDNVTDQNPATDPDAAFVKIEENLKQLLEVVGSLDKETKQKMDPILQEFRDEIVEHYKKTQERLEELKGELGHGKLHVKAIKAYSKL